MHLCDMGVPGLVVMMGLFLWQWPSWTKLQKWQLVRKRFEPYGRWLMLFVLMLIQQWFKRKLLMNWQDFVGKGMKLLKCKFVAWWVGTFVQQGTVVVYYILLITRMYWYTLNQIFNKSCFWNQAIVITIWTNIFSEFIFEYVRLWVNIWAKRLANKAQFWVVFLSSFIKMLGWYLDENMTTYFHILSKWLHIKPAIWHLIF